MEKVDASVSAMELPEVTLAKRCRNPLKMYEHYILPGEGVKPMELLGYCGVCAKLAFTDNQFPTSHPPKLKGGGKNATFINNDTL